MSLRSSSCIGERLGHGCSRFDAKHRLQIAEGKNRDNPENKEARFRHTAETGFLAKSFFHTAVYERSSFQNFKLLATVVFVKILADVII